MKCDNCGHVMPDKMSSLADAAAMDSESAQPMHDEHDEDTASLLHVLDDIIGLGDKGREAKLPKKGMTVSVIDLKDKKK